MQLQDLPILIRTFHISKPAISGFVLFEDKSFFKLKSYQITETGHYRQPLVIPR